ncbi:MAG: succinate dehydrogenase, cytochrome b556 subunit [Hyphomicrobiales bacterium]|nr:succinate dehydrogenase, cytochrome b556 subunit [Hyphomicrobiales bacterium]
MADQSRPLSPHLQIYRWSWTMAMSILHRATGAALYLGTLLLAVWLISAASGKASFDAAQWVASSWLGRLVLFGYTFALIHHMMGGLRHFVWDLGHGYEAQQRMNMARLTLFISAPLTILIWIVAYVVR